MCVLYNVLRIQLTELVTSLKLADESIQANEQTICDFNINYYRTCV
jgi:hypothetical protein